jgi:hypothetical protein
LASQSTEDYLKAAEDLLTPYEWGRYDVLLLPSRYVPGLRCSSWQEPTLTISRMHDLLAQLPLRWHGGTNPKHSSFALPQTVSHSFHDVLTTPVPIADSQQNPCLTFVTPTLLAGDRSLTDVVAHEIAHRYVPL